VRQSVTVVTPPAIQPVGSDELIAWARLNEDEDEGTLDLLIDAATQDAEQFMNRSLINRSLKLTLDLPKNSVIDRLGDGVYDLPITVLNGCMNSAINLPRGPVSSITSVKTYDTDNTESTFSSSNYTLDTTGNRLLLNADATWPSNLRPYAAIAIQYVAGYGSAASSIPAAIRNGILIHAATLYEQRGQCADAMDIPAGAKRLYSQYRIFGGTVG
jgi:hypothetical protein